MLPFWTRARRLLGSWWPWALVFVWLIAQQEWWWAVGSAAMGLFSYLIAPAAAPPRYGLDHEFPVESEEFVQTVAGASGAPFLPGNAITLLNNGDAFYPAMLEAIEMAEASITIEAYIYWAGDMGRTFAAALARQAQAGRRVKILIDAIGSSTIGAEILKTI